MQVEIPVAYTGEIDGSIYLDNDEQSKAVSNVIVQLIDAQDTVVAETTSAFDGFYLFSSVLPGEYRVQPSPEQAERLRLVAPAAQRITLTTEGDVLSGIDFVLESIAKVSPRNPRDFLD